MNGVSLSKFPGYSHPVSQVLVASTRLSALQRNAGVDDVALSQSEFPPGVALVHIGYSLEAIAEQASSLEKVRKCDLHRGDRVLVATQNSLYTIWVLNDCSYWVWGGWFDRISESPQRVTINGCTWGGTAIKRDIVAARGLRLEFGNTVLTTRIRHIQLIRAQAHFMPN